MIDHLRLPCETSCHWMLPWNDYFSFGYFIRLVCNSERTSFKITKYVSIEEFLLYALNDVCNITYCVDFFITVNYWLSQNNCS